MFKTFKKTLFVGIILQINHSFAQSTSDLQEVVVTATKNAQKMNQTGKVMTIIGDSTIKANAGLNLGQLLSQQVGTMVIGSNQPVGSQQNVTLRGANFGHTLILIDGIPVNEASGIGSTFDINLVPLKQVQQIEILKNGQSSLYGSDAIGGVINIITSQKNDGKFRISGNIVAGNLKTGQSNVGINGKINKTRYSISQSLQSTGGFSSAALAKNISMEADGYKTSNSQVSLTQNISNSLIVNGLYRFNIYKTDLDEGAFIDDKDYSYFSKNNQAGSNLKFQKNKTKIVINYLFNQTFRNFKNDSLDVADVAFSKYSNTNYLSKAHFVEIYSSYKLNKNFELLLGADFRSQNMSYDYFSVSSFGPFTDTPIQAKDAKISNQSIYNLFSLHLENGFGFELGGRLNNHSVYGGNATYSINPFFMINESLKLFASMSSNYKNPALYQLYSPFGNLDLKPEFAKTVDLGWQLFGKNASNFLRLVYFYRDYKDLIFFTSLNKAPYGQYVNLKNQKNEGLEIDGAYNFHKLSFSANYTLLTGKVTDDLNNYNQEISSFLRKPNHNFNLNFSYHFSSKINGSIIIQRQTKRNDLFYNSDTFANQAVVLDDFTQINTSWTYKLNESFDLFLNIQNLTKTKFTEIYGYSSRPLVALIGLNFLK